MKIAPKTLTGILNAQNKGACDWGWQGMLAYGCQNLAVVVDTRTMQVIQALDRHKGFVVKIKWALENYHHDLASPYSLRLASADSQGRVIVWDVAQAAVRSEFSDGNKPIAEMAWLSTQDASHDLLAVLHPPHSLVLWNADTGTKLWKKTYTETLQSFCFDPFDPSRMAFMGHDCILFVDDFSMSKMPASNGKKYYISTPSGSPGGMSGSSSSDKLSGNRGSKSTITKRMSNILVGESSKRPDEDTVSLNECIQLAYHAAVRHHLILLYPREILILDLDINQTVGIIPAERSGSPFTQVIALRERDVMMCLHENGSVSVRVRRRTNVTIQTPALEQVATFANSGEENSTSCLLDVSYELRCQSDPLRITKNNRVLGFAVDPVHETRLSLVMSDSRVLVWQLKTIDYQASSSVGLAVPLVSPLYTPGMPPAGLGSFTSALPAPKLALADLIHSGTIPTHNNDTGSVIGPRGHGIALKLILTGLLSGVANSPMVIRMCPPLTTKNWNQYEPLLAVGVSTGVVQVYTLSSGHLTREFSVHSASVRGIEWVSLHGFLSYSYSSVGSSGLVKNELILTDIQTGKTTPLRLNREEESPIDMIRVSYLKQYFVVAFKDKPFELWDLRLGTMLRQMPKNFPHVTALEWSPSHNLKSLKKRLNQEVNVSGNGSNEPTTPVAPPTSTAIDPSARNDASKHLLQAVTAREHFVFTDNDGLLYHFIVEGNVIKDGSKIPPDGGMGAITCIAWKGETMVLGDVDGNLNLWDLKARVSRSVPTHRGWIRKIKFAPGRGNMKLLVLYHDGIDIFDTKEVNLLLSSVKCPRDLAKVVDADWAGSDRPVLACADGTIRVTDLRLQQTCSSVEEHQVAEPVLSPHLVPAKAALTLKAFLQHQPWSPSYGLELDETESNADIVRCVNQQLALLDGELKEYMPNCPFGTAQRCLYTARLFGDESELNFWTVALFYLRQETSDPANKELVKSVSEGDIFVPTTPGGSACMGSQNVATTRVGNDRPLDSSYDVLCDNKTFQKNQLDRVALHDNKRSTYEHTRKCAETLMLLGQTDRAVQLLLETEPDNAEYLNDCLKACLVASIRSSGASQSTIKLVATNLIASGKLSEGVQLLCLIDKGLDACRYLQTYGAWDQAAWLAKATLSFSECSEVLKRWADQLCSPQVNQKSQAILVMLSLGQFVKVIEMLYSVRHFDRATLFIEACQEFGLLDSSPDTTSLVEAVLLEYARHLVALGHEAPAKYYCNLAGDKGKQLVKEIDNMFDR